MLLHRADRYRIYPSAEQLALLEGWQGAQRLLWNIALEQRLACLAKPRDERVFLTAFDQINQLKALRAEYGFLGEVPRDVQAELLVELDKAWQRCFKKLADRPRFKKKGRDEVSLCAPQAFRVEADAIVFPKLGRLRAVIHRPLSGTPKTCTVKRDGDQWFASVSCEREVEDPPLKTEPRIGIDRGVVNLVADSDGGRVSAPQSFKNVMPRLRRAQRQTARKQKGSENQKKARVKVARLHRKARRQRDAVLHRESLRYANNHGTVVLERLNIQGMTRSARGTVEEPGRNVAAKAGLNRGILDAGWGKFGKMLAYKLEERGGQIVEVDAAYTSQTCSLCSAVSSKSRKSQSEFVCVVCGHQDHADVNAAKVILSRGTHGGAVCGGSGSRGRPTKQKLRVARRGPDRGQTASPMLR